jgi:DNA-binding beta-propeller fold protein YncE
MSPESLMISMAGEARHGASRVHFGGLVHENVYPYELIIVRISSLALKIVLKSSFVVLPVATLCLSRLGVAAGDQQARVLPGMQAGGSVLLPNQWSLRPAGRQMKLGVFPVNIAVHPSGRWLAVLHAGFGRHEVITVDLARQANIDRAEMKQAFYGLCFAPDGKQLFASGGEEEVVHAFEFDEGHLRRHRAIDLTTKEPKLAPGGITVDSRGRNLLIAGTWGDAVAVVPLDRRESAQANRIILSENSYPYTCLADPSGNRVWTTLWLKSAVAVIDLEKNAIVATWPTELHPTEMVLSPDGKILFVACANSTKVSVLETASGKSLQTISCALFPGAPAGNTPNSLCLTPDGSLLFVANANNNNIAVCNVNDPNHAKSLGFIPVGWYPTSVRFNAKDNRVYVANAKGIDVHANPKGPQPTRAYDPTKTEYIAGLYHGTMSTIDLPSPEQMVAYTQQAYACSPLQADLAAAGIPSPGNPIPKKIGEPSPIKHVFYVIKENRTYDQVLGDMKEGNGDPNLCLFPEDVTPNHHQLARDFVLLDNFYAEGEVSADGHEWSMAAYATDFIEKTWPLYYRRVLKKIHFPGERPFDRDALPAGGYLWDRCAEQGVSYRDYGEFVENGKTPTDPPRVKAKALEGHVDLQYRAFDLDYTDQKRADHLIEELNRFERAGGMPSLSIIHLPNDHTSGTKVGKPTPTAAMADNDLALGRFVEAVSRSKFWRDTAIFVVEDDAQNGPDHVEAHRIVALVISPYARRGAVDSSLYSTTSMVRTIELILGLKPMSQFDAAARPMYASFQPKPDLRPFQHLTPKTDLTERNRPDAYGAALSEKFDLTRQDAVDDLLLNDIIWHSVRGRNTPMPAPVHAAFFIAHRKAGNHEDDD